MKKLWYYFIKYVIKTSLFFYSKRIKVVGLENIPKKGAVLFMVNHPNGLLDPLVVASNNPRVLHFLVKAAVFKNPMVKKLLSTLNLMPIYRIRDGVKELSKNNDVFETCFHILKNQKALMIFPEGSHNRMRTIRPLSKGFTRILYGALEKYPEIKIQIIPVGLTYQNASQYPSKIALQYGKPILVNTYFEKQNSTSSIVELKEQVSNQLKKLTVHIPFDNQYDTTLNKLNKADLDFTKVSEVNKIIDEKNFKKETSKFNFILFLKPLIILNTLVPWLVWKQLKKQIDEVEFIDTFRFGINTIFVFIFYFTHTLIVYYFFNITMAIIYLLASLLLLYLYAKLHTTPAESIVE